MTYFEQMQEKLKKIREQKTVRVLAIETSCDETSVAVVENGRKVLSNIISSQIDIHTRFGGVVPEVASRNHILSINPIIEQALLKANVTMNEIDVVAVTQGAGLVGALLVGVNTAKALAYAYEKPLIAVNHIKGHIAANYISHPNLTPPFCCLIVSGGHTAIVKVENYTSFKLLGSTQDDAIGEAFDKVARVVGLGYPGGPKIDKIAKDIKPTITFIKHDTFENSYDVSYSGLKTAVINYVNTQKQSNKSLDVANICASFQKQAVEMVAKKAIKACKDNNLNTLVLAGGVAANSCLRNTLQNLGKENDVTVLFPDIELCTDNAAMIGSLAYFNLQTDEPAELSMSAKPSIPL